MRMSCAAQYSSTARQPLERNAQMRSGLPSPGVVRREPAAAKHLDRKAESHGAGRGPGRMAFGVVVLGSGGRDPGTLAAAGSSATARRSASSNAIGVDVEERRAGRVGHGRPRRQPLDQRPRDAGVDRRDEADPERGEPRREERDGQLAAAAAGPSTVGHPVEHLAVGEDVRAADLDLAARRSATAGAARGRRARRRSRSAASALFSQAGAIIAGSRSTR